MIAALLALVGALVYGAADFLGGLAARRVRPVAVTAVSALSGLLLLALAYPVLGGAWSPEDALWGALSGVTGAAAIGLLYACLAIGPMSILSPVTAVVSAIAPMLWGILIGGERLTGIGYAGLALALIAVVLVAFLPGEAIARPSARGLVMAVGSGLSIGAFLILIDQTSQASGVVPLLLNRGVNVLITGTIVVIAVVAARRGGVRAGAALGSARGGAGRGMMAGRAWTIALACGLVDATANVLLLLALRSDGDLAVVAALTALYPAGTVLLAAIVLGERIARIQWVGLTLALAAGALLAIG